MHIYIIYIIHYTSIYRLVQASGTTYDGVGGWGGMLTFMWTCGSSWCYAHAGWGGVGWDVNVHVNLGQDVNVHVNLRQQLMLRTRGVGGVGWDVNVHVNLRLDVNIHVNLRQQLMMMWWWWWWWWWRWWWWWWWPWWNLLIPRRNFVTEWTSFADLIQVCAVPEAWTRLYIHIL